METNFRSLFSKVQNEKSDSIYFEGARLAERLIATEQDTRVLHGDIHHENILKSSIRGCR
jgi:streptomycin 6-kinase